MNIFQSVMGGQLIARWPVVVELNGKLFAYGMRGAGISFFKSDQAYQIQKNGWDCILSGATRWQCR